MAFIIYPLQSENKSVTRDRHSKIPLFRLDVTDNFGIFPSSHSPYTLGHKRPTQHSLNSHIKPQRIGEKIQQKHRFKIKLNRSCNDKIAFFKFTFIYFIFICIITFRTQNVLPSPKKDYLLNWTAVMASSFQKKILLDSYKYKPMTSYVYTLVISV